MNEKKESSSGDSGNGPLSPKTEEGLNSALTNGPHATLENVHPADVADHLESLDLDEKVRWIEDHSLDLTADAIAEMERHDRKLLMEAIPAGLAADLLEAMSPDDAADVLAELDPSVRTMIFRSLEREDARTIARLLRYDPDTAGGVMNTDIILLDQELTVEAAVKLVRRELRHTEITHYAYLVDNRRRLIGALSLRDLLINPVGTRLVDLLKEQNLIYVTYGVDKEEVARLISRYNLLAIPVVDHEQRLLGAVTVDDVIDIIQEEASEDMQRMVGAGSDETLDSPWTYSLRKRLPWLVLNLFYSSLSAWVVHLFRGTIAQMAILAVFMPIVANQAGNTGQQALAVMIRQLALEEFAPRKVWPALGREFKIGLANGLVIAFLVFLGVGFLTDNFALAGVMSVALGADMLIGAVGGIAIPLLLRACNRDPAQASSIFLTTLTDSAGFFVFLGLAGLFLL